MTFGEKLSSLRKQANWSQSDVAIKLNVSRQVVSKWEKGAGLPDIDNLKKVALIFGKTIDEMLDYKVENVNIEINETTEKISKENSKLKNVNNFILQRFDKASNIYILTRELKMNVWQWFLDFFIGAGTLEVADLLKTGIVYPYLVEIDNEKFLVLVQKTTLFVKKLDKSVGDKFVVDGYKYKKEKQNKLK